MDTTAVETLTTRQIGEQGEIYLGARAAAQRLHCHFSSHGLEQRQKVMRCLGAKFDQVSEQASVLLKDAYTDAGSGDKHLLLATVLAFYGTRVEVTPEEGSELAGLPLTTAKFNYWKEVLAESVERLVQTAYDPQAPLDLLAAGRLVENFLDGLPSHEARVAGLTFILMSDFTPYLPPTPLMPDDEAAIDVLLKQVGSLIEELVYIVQRTPMTNFQIVTYAFRLAKQAELSPEQNQVFLAGVVKVLCGAIPSIAVLLCPGHEPAEREATKPKPGNGANPRARRTKKTVE